jgi:protein-S-isoprenylcysteine O-methyltransferase Ste14
MAALYFDAATREERKFAMSELGSAYAAYRAQAGMFLPRPSSFLAG